MSRNRRRHKQTNQVPLGAFSPLLLGALIVLAGGMTWVYFRNTLVSAGKQQQTLEREYSELSTQNAVLRAHIANLSSRTALQKRLSDGYISMIPVDSANVVRLDFSQPHQRMARSAPIDGEVQPVVNQGGLSR